MNSSSFASGHHRVFDRQNPHWNEQDRKKNAIFVSFVQDHLNGLLKTRGYVSLNEAYELLGFPRTVLAGQNGWIRDVDPAIGDSYISFGVWSRGFARGKDWVEGKYDHFTLSFNVDRIIVSMPRRVKQLREEGKI